MLRHAARSELRLDGFGHLQARGRHVVETDVVERQEASERMDGAAVLEVAHHGHDDVVQMAQLVVDGEPGSKRRNGITCPAELARDARQHRRRR